MSADVRDAWRGAAPSWRPWLIGLGLVLAAAGGFAAALMLQRSQPAAQPPAAQAMAPSAVDIGFAQFMTVHHDQAVTMSQIVLSDGTGELRAVAQAISLTQLIEIGQMRGWLLAWKQSTIPTTKNMDWLLLGKQAPTPALLQYIADCKASPGGMPGVATTDELNRLRDLDGAERDVLFLQLMIRHHRAALPMAQFARENADTELIRTLATQIVFEQHKEIGALAALLEARSAS